MLMGMPPQPQPIAGRGVASGVTSRGWLKWVWIQILPEAREEVDQLVVVKPLGQRDGYASADPDRRRGVAGRSRLSTKNASFSSGKVSGSPPEMITSWISGWSRTYSTIRRSSRETASQPPRFIVARLRVQNRQYIVQTCVVTSRARSG